MARAPSRFARLRPEGARSGGGSGRQNSTRNYGKSVFINCPFDRRFQKLFDAFVFTIVDCGFIARCALEIDNGAQNRFDKIVRLIGACALSVHDLSRTQLDRKTRLPRFNMPLELGLFLGAERFGSGRDRKKSCVIFDTERYRYQTFISDIAGQDIKCHRDDAAVAIVELRNWLARHAPSVDIPSGGRINSRFQRFERALPQLCNDANLDRRALMFHERIKLIERWIEKVAP